jgi:hypothetical protein
VNEAVLQLLRDRLAREPNVVAAWLFGSTARGTETASSDVDLALLGTPAPRSLEDMPFDLAAELASAIGREVDIIRLESSPPDLAIRVLRDGILLVDRDRAVRLRFEVDARNRYFDMQPIWREYQAGSRPR